MPRLNCAKLFLAYAMSFAVGANSQPQRVVLAEALSGLGNPVRLALLEELRAPKALREIEVRSPEAGALAERAERPISRQAVREHLDKLLEIGVVQAREAEREYGPTLEYVLNNQSLFAVAEQVRALAKLRPTEAPAEPTVEAERPAGEFDLQGPCLVLVHGLDEGATFRLKPEGGRAEWVIGRRRGLAIPLDFDPYVSTENTLVQHEDGTYFVRNLPESRNGTWLNFRLLPPDRRHALRTGDLLGVGRCLLMFHG